MENVVFITINLQQYSLLHSHCAVTLFESPEIEE